MHAHARRAGCCCMALLGCTTLPSLDLRLWTCSKAAAAAVQGFYSATLEALAEAQNERLWFKTQLKLCGLWFGLKEYGRAHRILKELHK